jgi:hypothetical protein
MKPFRWLTAAVLLGVTQMAQSSPAQCNPCYSDAFRNGCENNFCEVEYKAYVDALYWNTRHGDSFCGDYNWGYRIGAAASWSGWDLGMRYTSLKNSTRRADDSPVEEEFFTLENLRLSQNIDFQILDAELGRSCCVFYGLTLRPFFGVKFTWIDTQTKFNAEIIGTETPLMSTFEAQDSVYLKGKGLYIGFDSRWKMCSFDLWGNNVPLAFVTRASTGILKADFDVKFSITIFEGTDFPIVDSFSSDRHYVSIHELYAGLEFRFCKVCNVDALMQIGYEAQVWQAFNKVESTSHQGIGGLVLRFGAGF